MTESSKPNTRDRRPLWFVATWSVSMVALTVYLERLIQTDRAPPPAIPPTLSPINQANYDAIHINIKRRSINDRITYDWDVANLLGEKGETLDDPTLPRTLRELPGWENTERSIKVTWMKWSDPNAPERWIAVGSIRGNPAIKRYDEPRLIVAKRKNGF